MTSSADLPLPAGNAEPAAARARRRPAPPRKPPSRFASVPVTVRVGVPLLLAVWLAWRFWPQRIAVQAVGFLGSTAQVDGLAVEIFPFDDSGAGTYPPAPSSSRPLSGGGTSLAAADVPAGGVYLRADSPIHGVTCVYAASDRSRVELELGEPRSLVGRIVDTQGTPLAGARVVALPHRYGPELGEARSDEHGDFAVPRLSSSLSWFAVRVLLPGFAALDTDVQLVPGVELTLTLGRSRPVQGRVEVPASVPLSGLLVCAYRCPGVTAPVRADGTFVLESLPAPPIRARLLLHGLPADLTHSATYATAGEEGLALRAVVAATARGYVVTADRDLPVPGAYVQHPHGPGGGVGVYTDGNGAFVIGGLPPGRVRLEAFGGPRRAAITPGEPPALTVPFGSTEVDVDDARSRDAVVLRIH